MFGTTQSIAPAGRAVVVTGASSGLGRQTVLSLERLGYTVYAGVRKSEDGEKLAAEAAFGRVRRLRLDLRDEESALAAAEQVAEAEGASGLWGLVNNAGVCVSAPLECLPGEELRHQLDVNVVGSVAVTRAFLPLLRRSHGRVVNVTSGLGSVAIPYLGAYAAAQFAKEAVSDALRREMRPFGVAVSVVQPGAIMTPIWDKVSDGGQRLLDAAPADVAACYRETFERFLESNADSARRSSTKPEDFARAVFRALTATRPRARYRVGRDARSGAALARVLPDAGLDRLFTRITGTAPRRGTVEERTP